MSRQFRCTHCGDYFTLSKDDQEAYENGMFINDPDTCEDCCNTMNNPSHDTFDLHSDADPGL